MKKIKPRNSGTWTEARYWSQVRSYLRSAFQYWKPIVDAKHAARIPNTFGLLSPKGKPLKWASKCASCGGLFPEAGTQVDHIQPVGTLKCEDDLVTFLHNLSAESGYQVLCTKCHNEKTQKEKRLCAL